MENTSYARFIATKITIQEILQGDYVQEEGQEPNYLITNAQKKVYRINLLAVVLGKQKQGTITEVQIDDGTGKMALRFFEENKIVDKINSGTAVLIIGRIRTYDQERYVSPEIIKPVSTLWLKVRGAELKNNASRKDVEEDEQMVVSSDKNKTKKTIIKNQVQLEGKKIEEEESAPPLLPIQKTVQLIKELDSGEGVMIEELLEKSPLQETEKLIGKMLEQGDIFQIAPGRVKVL